MHGRNLKPKSDNNSDGGMPDRSPTGHQHTRSSVKSGVSPTQPPWGDSSVVLHRRREEGTAGEDRRDPLSSLLFCCGGGRRTGVQGQRPGPGRRRRTRHQDRTGGVKSPSCSAVPAQGRRCACRGRQGEWERVVRMERAEWGSLEMKNKRKTCGIGLDSDGLGPFFAFKKKKKRVRHLSPGYGRATGWVGGYQDVLQEKAQRKRRRKEKRSR